MKKSLLGLLLFLPLFCAMAGEIATAEFAQKDGKWQYTQDFNSLWKTSAAGYVHQSFAYAADYWVKAVTLPGWYLSRYGTENVESFRMDNGGTYTAAAFYSYGYLNGATETKPNTGKTDAECQNRSLGSVANTASGANQFMSVLIKNNTDASISKLDIAYTGHLWKGPNYATNPTGRAEKLEFSYAVNPTITLGDSCFNNHDISDDVITGTLVPSLDFIRPANNDAMGTKAFGKMDGRAPQNMASISGSIDVVIPAGQTVLLRWKDAALVNESHNYGKAIDDLVVTATTVTSGVTPNSISDIKVYNIKNAIVVESNGNERISVYALDGRTMASVQATSKTTTIPNFKAGNVYIVKVGSDSFKIAF